jgi:hypothetical protein
MLKENYSSAAGRIKYRYILAYILKTDGRPAGGILSPGRRAFAPWC